MLPNESADFWALSLKITTHHVELADTRYGLGSSDMSKIDLIKLASAMNHCDK